MEIYCRFRGKNVPFTSFLTAQLTVRRTVRFHGANLFPIEKQPHLLGMRLFLVDLKRFELSTPTMRM